MNDNSWQPDALGEGFEKKYVDMGRDYSGPVRCTVIRRRIEGADKAAVYVHGFSDYFFQKEMALEFNTHGYSYYAVDLRKYGRSLLEGQKPFQVRAMNEYFPDIQAAVDAAKADGAKESVLIGHSTGGLTASLYMMSRPDPSIKALILNSPFLAWNLPRFMTDILIPAIKPLAKLWPSLKIKSGGTIDYNDSISSRLHGEWDYDNRLKPDVMPDVDAGWIRAIDNGQQSVAKGSIKVPVLFMHSDKSAHPGDSRQAYAISDGVLDVEKLSKAGRHLGDQVTEVTIRDGLHDLILSRKDVREEVYRVIFNWLDVQLTCAD